MFIHFPTEGHAFVMAQKNPLEILTPCSCCRKWTFCIHVCTYMLFVCMYVPYVCIYVSYFESHSVPLLLLLPLRVVVLYTCLNLCVVCMYVHILCMYLRIIFEMTHCTPAAAVAVVEAAVA